MEEKILTELREIKRELQTIASSLEQKEVEIMIDGNPVFDFHCLTSECSINSKAISGIFQEAVQKALQKPAE